MHSHHTHYVVPIGGAEFVRPRRAAASSAPPAYALDAPAGSSSTSASAFSAPQAPPAGVASAAAALSMVSPLAGRRSARNRALAHAHDGAAVGTIIGAGPIAASPTESAFSASSSTSSGSSSRASSLNSGLPPSHSSSSAPSAAAAAAAAAFDQQDAYARRLYEHTQHMWQVERRHMEAAAHCVALGGSGGGHSDDGHGHAPGAAPAAAEAVPMRNSSMRRSVELYAAHQARQRWGAPNAPDGAGAGDVRRARSLKISKDSVSSDQLLAQHDGWLAARARGLRRSLGLP